MAVWVLNMFVSFSKGNSLNLNLESCYQSYSVIPVSYCGWPFLLISINQLLVSVARWQYRSWIYFVIFSEGKSLNLNLKSCYHQYSVIPVSYSCWPSLLISINQVPVFVAKWYIWVLDMLSSLIQWKITEIEPAISLLAVKYSMLWYCSWLFLLIRIYQLPFSVAWWQREPWICFYLVKNHLNWTVNLASSSQVHNVPVV